MNFLRTYIFRGIGLVLVLGMIAVLFMACHRDADEKARAKRALREFHGDPSAAIRKYTQSTVQKVPAKPAGGPVQ